MPRLVTLPQRSLLFSAPSFLVSAPICPHSITLTRFISAQHMQLNIFCWLSFAGRTLLALQNVRAQPQHSAFQHDLKNGSKITMIGSKTTPMNHHSHAKAPAQYASYPSDAMSACTPKTSSNPQAAGHTANHLLKPQEESNQTVS